MIGFAPLRYWAVGGSYERRPSRPQWRFRHDPRDAGTPGHRSCNAMSMHAATTGSDHARLNCDHCESLTVLLPRGEAGGPYRSTGSRSSYS